MELISGSVCPVCCKEFCSSPRHIDEDVLKLLKFLFKKTNCSALRNTQICENCLEKVQDACNFKMYVEKKTLNVALKMEQIDPEILCTCQICKESIKKSSFVPITTVLKQIEYLIEEMRMEVEITEDSRVCTSCQESIASFHCVVKLFSNFVKNNEHKCKVNIVIEPSTDPNKIEIKQEPSMEYENIAKEHLTVKSEPLEMEGIKYDINTESKHSNEANLTYQDFIMKNEEIDIKLECEESDSTEQMRKVIQEHDQINPRDEASKHFTDNHKNNENTSRTIKIYNVSNIPKFMCFLCDYTTKQKDNLKKHLLKHKNADEIETFACDVCEYKTKRKFNLKMHMLTHKNVDEIKMFPCDVCDYKAKGKSTLRRHMLRHKSVDEIEIFTCNVCDYKTKHKCDLKRHMLTHKNVDEIEIFTCNVCDYKTKRKRNLKTHMLKHMNADEIESFKCNVCDYTTKQKEYLKSHMLRHKSVDEIEIFTCNVCDFKTKRKRSLKMHMLKHMNADEIEMFACEVCDFKTKRRGNLKRHALKHKNVVSINKITCKTCGFKIEHKKIMKSHTLLIHNNG